MESEIQALKNIKIGSLYYFIAIVLALVTESLAITIKSLSTSAAFLVLELIAYVILILGFSKLRVGFFTISKEINTNIGITGINIFIFGVIALLFSDIFSILLYLGAFLIVLGNVMIGLNIYKIGQNFEGNMEKVAGILIMITVTSFIGYIISYFASDELIKKVSQTPEEKPLQIVTTDKNVGYGILKSNGDANFTVYSKGVSEIVSAQIIGYNFQVLQISPKTVGPGENKIYIKFNLSGLLSPGNIYNVEILLANNEKLLASLVYEI
ncbi:DUF973 family protein [Acidianus brierleyi]|uniref:DUF973 domain-containing protein n=1 Tax=Acidianus brierleyi TaxID=41673 RepID=A0A2U9IDL4_9CREN|nr:DUF973 family protein [Acidianus brierleyi]AWR94089.1 DUF973 family protein [Acidianus brierleyi]